MRFAEYTLDLAGFELRRGSSIIDMEPQVFEVLKYLVTHRDRLVPKNELLDEVWGSPALKPGAWIRRADT